MTKIGEKQLNNKGAREMTIEEIKEIRATVRVTEQEYFNAHAVEIADTLLAEVATLEKHNASSDQDVVTLDQQLTIATEALNQIANHFSELPADERIVMIMRGRGRIEDVYQYIARTALERMKG